MPVDTMNAEDGALKEAEKPHGGEEARALALVAENVSGGGHDILPENITGQTKIPLQGYADEVWGTEKDLDENAYGCAAVALVRECTTISIELEKGRIKALTLVRLGCSMGIMATNLALQFMILRYISSYVVEPAVRHVQMSYSHFHANVFDDDGNFQPEAWDAYPYQAEVCQITMADSTFYYLLILLWTLKILDELRHIHRFVDEVTSIRGCTLARHMLEFVDTENNDAELGGRCLITALTMWMRCLLLLLVFLPRAIIAVYLLVLGCRWLSASANFADMVLNALALVFVTDIDELLYEAVLPMALKKQIEDTNWFFIEEPKTREQVEETEWTLYRQTFVWLLITAVFLVAYGMFLQSVLPFGLTDIGHHCQGWMAQSEEPLCDKVSWSGWNRECYPFGGAM